MYIRRRNHEHGRIKRTIKKAKSSESSFSCFGTSIKILTLWAAVVTLDFFTDFRFEFLYSCWLFARTVLDSFRYQGLAFALFFTLIAMTSDLICYFLIPSTLIHLLGSSFVWVQLVWHTDRGFYGPTVALCFLFVYVEIAVRLRDPKALPLGIDLCRPFAAHCVGYPAVTLGFVLKTMVSHHVRLRRQQSVEAQNGIFFALLEEALPKELRVYLKPDETTCKTKRSPILADSCPLALPSSTGVCVRTPPAGLKETASGSSNTGTRNHTPHPNRLNSDPSTNHGAANSFDFYLNSQNTGYAALASLLPEDPPLPDVIVSPQLVALNAMLTEFPQIAESEECEQLNKSTALPIQSNSWGSDPDNLLELSSLQEPSNSSDPVAVPVISSECKQDSHSMTPKAPSSVCSMASYSSTSSNTSSSSLHGANNGRNNRAEVTGCLKGNEQNCPSSTQYNTVSGQTTTVTATDSSKSVASDKHSPSVASNPKGANKDEYTLKLQSEVKQLRSEVQSLRSLEVDLRSQVQQMTTAERTYRSESSQARQEAEVLQGKLNQLTQRLETDRAALQAAEKRLVEERKQRTTLEQQLSGQQQQLRKSAKTRKDIASAGEVNSQSANKCKSPTIPSTSPCPTTTTTISCTSSESCGIRLKELEAELRTLTHDLSVKEMQLTALKDNRYSQGFTDPKDDNAVVTHPASMDQSERMELLTKLQCLQEENQRMTDTLKEEDKMKQELMTAYHTALKEITELNSSLTKKEYQIVELNMRLEGLTPQLCEYVNMMSMTSKLTSNMSQSSLNSHPGDQQTQYASYLPDSSIPRYHVAHSNLKDVRRAPADEHGYPDGRSAPSSTNGCASVSVSGYPSSPLVGYPNSNYNSNFFDTVGVRELPNVHPVVGDGLNSLDGGVYARSTNGCGGQHADFANSPFSSIVDTQVLGQGQPLPQSIFTRFPHRSSGNSMQYNSMHVDNQVSARRPHHLSASSAAYPQLGRFKSHLTSGSRPLPVGSAAAPTSSPPPCYSVPPPGLMHSNPHRSVLNTTSFPYDFHSYSSAHSTASLELHVTTSSTLHSPTGFEMTGTGATPKTSSINCLIESLSPLSHSPNANLLGHFRRGFTATTHSEHVSNSLLSATDTNVPDGLYRRCNPAVNPDSMGHCDFTLTGSSNMDGSHHKADNMTTDVGGFAMVTDTRFPRTTSDVELMLDHLSASGQLTHPNVCVRRPPPEPPPL